MRARIVFHRTEDERGEREGGALLYPVDAGPFTRPDAAYTLSPNQELPDVEVGGVVEAVLDDEPYWPSGDDRTPVVRLRVEEERRTRTGFAEARGGPVVAHPRHADRLSPFAWEGSASSVVSGSAFQRFEEWASHAHKEHRTAWWTLVLGVPTFAAIVVAELLHDGGGSVHLYFAGTGLVAAFATLRRMRARRRVLAGRSELDVDSAPRTPMLARRWWAIGADRPVEPWLTLYDRDRPDDGPVVSLPVLDVDVDDLGDDVVAVTVIGDPAPGGLVVVEVDEADGPDRVEPAGRCTDEVHTAAPPPERAAHR